MDHSARRWLPLGASVLTILISLGAAAHDATPFPGTHVIKTGHSYQAMVKKLPEAVTKNKMGVVAKASATLVPPPPRHRIQSQERRSAARGHQPRHQQRSLRHRLYPLGRGRAAPEAGRHRLRFR